MQIREIGELVRRRREQLGLSQERLARFSGLSRVTINQLERGSLKDLGIAKLIAVSGLLGIDITAQTRQPKANGLHMASVTSGISYRNQISAAALAQALASGEIPAGYKAQVAALLNEAPLEIIVKAVEEAAHKAQMTPKEIWRHIRQWALQLQTTRPALCH